MSYHVRKADREIKELAKMIDVIKKGNFAILALCNNNEPYIVTLSYGFDEANESLYFHGAKEGLKTDFLKINPKVCVTILDDKGYIPNECAHAYRSLVIRGEIEFLENDEEKIKGIGVLLNHFESNPDRMMEKIRQKMPVWDNTVVLRLQIREITGKERSIVQHK